MKSQWFKKALSLIVMVACAEPASGQQESALPTGEEFTNSIGMKFVRIEAGRFRMGSEEVELPPAVLEAKEAGGGTVWLPSKGDYDERPAHVVSMSKPIYMAGLGGVQKSATFVFRSFLAEQLLCRIAP
jgi:formylglycine-generating enzyme required for sulfatase activity